MNDQLYELPNGTWIDPKSVFAIMPLDKVTAQMEENGPEVNLPARVVIMHGGLTSMLIVDDVFEGVDLARKLATEINALRG